MSELAVQIKDLNKVYKLYNRQIDRLKEATHPFKKKYHNEFYALKNINLDIKKGEVLGIVGVNGAGKSTLLKIISKVLTQTSGSLKINGKINAILELGSALNAEMTGIENIKFNLQINQITDNIQALVDEIIEFADIGEHIRQPVKTYSSGMQARLGFGIATMTNPDILIVDEVLAVGDAIFQRKCYAKIEQLFKDGKTVIFVSHDAQSVIHFCSRAVLLYDREIILDSDPKTVTDYYQKLIFSDDKGKILREMSNTKTKKKSTYLAKDKNSVNVIKSELQQKTSTGNKKTESLINVTGSNYIATQEEYFSKELVPKNTIYYEEKGCKISNVKITTLEGKEVNVLNHGQEYIYHYEVTFNKNIPRVVVQFVIKKINGLEIGGGAYLFAGEEMVNPSTIIVKWRWVNLFNPGVYYMNAGVTSNNQFIHRITDVCGFRTQPSKEILSTLHINCVRDLMIEKNGAR